MKKRNFKTILLAVIAFLALALGIATTRNVQAAELKATLSYKTYSYTDYQIKSDFTSVYGFDYDLACISLEYYSLYGDSNEYDPADFGYDTNAELANAFWNGDLLKIAIDGVSKPTTTIQKKKYTDGWWETNVDTSDYFNPLGVYTISDVWYFSSDGKTEYKKNIVGAGFTYDVVKSAVESYDNLAETKEFNPGDKIVIEAYAVVPAGVNTIQISYDPRMKSLGNSTAFSTDSTAEFYTNSADFGTSTISTPGINGIVNIGSSTENNVPIIIIGGGFEDGNKTTTEELFAGAIAITVDNNASGTYRICASEGDNTFFQQTASSSAYKAYSDSSYFNFGYVDVEVKGESTNAVLDPSSIKIGSDSPTSSGTDSSTGKTKYTFGDVSSSTTSVDLAVSAAERGTITSVKYTTTPGSLTGTAATTTASGKYAIPLGDAGTTTYAIVEVQAQTGGATETFIIEIPRAKYSDADITGMAISATASGASATHTLRNSHNTANETFSSGTTSYTIVIPNNVDKISFTPTVDYSKFMTCTVDGNAVTSSSPSYEVTIGSKTSINVVVRSQDGTSSKTYEFKIHKLSTDTSISGIVIKDSSGTNFTPSTYTDSLGRTVYKVTGVDYTKTGFTVTPTLNSSGSSMTVDGASLASGSTSTLIPFATGVTSSTTKSIVIVVTSEGGTTQTYVVEVERNAASTGTTLTDSNIKVYDSSNNLISGSLSGNVWTSSTNMSYSKTGFYIKVTAPTVPTTATFKTSATGSYSAYTYGSNSGTVAYLTTEYSVTTKIAYLKVLAQDGTTFTEYEFHVTRDAANSNSGINKTATKVYDNSGNEIAGTWDSTGKKWTASSNIPYSSTGFYVVAVADSAASGTSTAQYKTSGAYASYTFGNNSVIYSFASTDYSQTSKTSTLKVIAQDTTFTEYEFEVTRDAANNNSLIDTTTTKVYDNSGNEITGTWSSDGKTWTADNKVGYSTTGFYIYVVADSAANSTSKLGFKNSASGTYASASFGANLATISFSGVAQVTKTAYIKVTAQDTTFTEYTFNVTREQANDDATFTYTLVDNNGSSIPLTLDSSTNTYTNNTLLKTNVSSIKLTVSPTSSSTKALIGGVDYANLSYTKNVELTMSGGVFNPSPVTTVVVVIETAYGNLTTYTFNISSEPLDTDCSLDSSVGDNGIQVKGQKDNVFYNAKSTANDTYEYELPQASAGTQFYLFITTASSKATIRYSTNPNAVTSPTTGNAFTSGMLLDCDETYYVTIFAEYTGSKNNITIIVKYTDTRDTHNDIVKITTDIELRDTTGKKFEFDNAILDQGTYTVPYSVKQITFTVVLESTSETLVQGTNGIATLAAGSNIFRFQGKAENLTLGRVYEITIVRNAAETGNTISNLEINGNAVVGYASGTGIYLLNSDANITDANIDITVVKGASFEASYVVGSSTNTETSNFSINGMSNGTYILITISVKSEKDRVDGNATVKTYNIYLICASNDADVSNIRILETDEFGADLKDTTDSIYTFNSATINNTFSIAYSAANPYFDVTAHSPYAAISGDGAQTIAKGATATNKTFSVVIKSQYKTILDSLSLTDSSANSNTYSFKFTREAPSNDNSLSLLEIIIDGVKHTVNLATATFPYAIENVGAASQATVNATATDSKALVTGDIGTKNLSFVTGSNNTETLHVYVKNEAGITMDYQIILAKTTLVLDSVNTISNIKVVGGTDSKDYLTYNATQNAYNVTIRATVATANIMVTRTSSLSRLEFSVDGNVVSTSDNYIIALVADTSTTVSIKCIAQDGTANATIYNITIVVPAIDTNANLSGLKYNGINIPGFSSTTYDYTINVENHITSIELAPTKDSDNSNITGNDAPSGSPYSLLVGTNVLIVTVVAEDGVTTKRYSVTVIRDDTTTLDDLTVETELGELVELTPTFDPETKAYTATVPYKVDKVIVDGSKSNDTYVTITGIGTVNLTAGISNKITVTVKAASGAKTEYIIRITREAGSDDNYITSFVTEALENLTISTALQNYTYVLTRDTNTINPSFTNQFAPTITVSANAEYTLPADPTLNPGRNTMEITVTSQTGKTRKYVFTVYYADTNFDIDNIVVRDKNGVELTDSDGNKLVDYASAQTTYSLTVPYSLDSINLVVTTLNQYASIFVNGQPYSTGLIKSLNTGLNTITVYAKSEYGVVSNAANTTSPTYTINITRNQADTDSSLSELKVLVGGVDILVGFNPSVLEYTLTNVLATSIQISASTNKSTATILSGTGIKTITQDGENFEIVVEAENKTKTTYKLTILKSNVPLDEDNTIAYIEVISDGNELLGETTFNQGQTSYSFNIAYGTKSVTIQGFKSSISLATVSPKITVTPTNWGTSEDYVVFATSQKGDKGQEYTITLVFEAGDSDSSLSSLKVNGVLIQGFDPTVTDYTLEAVINSITEISIYAKPTSTKASIDKKSNWLDFEAGELDNSVKFKFALVEGDNTITVTIKAQDGSSSDYTIHIKRAAALPMISGLKVEGSNLYDQDGKPVETFDPSINKYMAILEYNVGSNATNGNAVIKISVENIGYTVTCTQTVFDTAVSSGNIRIFNHSTLEAGKDNVVIITVSQGNVENEYELIIKRKPEPNHNAGITDIEIKDNNGNKIEFTYSSDPSVKYEITVPNKVNDLNIEAFPEFGKNPDSEGAKPMYINNNNLKTGENKVYVVMTAEDGITQKVVEIVVHREAMDFQINTNATSFECTLDETDKNRASINLGKKNSSAISDYTTYIDKKGNDHLQVTVVNSDAVSKGTATEVLLRVFDGTNEQFVTLATVTVAAGPQGVSWVAWLLLVVAILLLLVILSAVLNDKYGAISKSRKKLD